MFGWKPIELPGLVGIFAFLASALFFTRKMTLSKQVSHHAPSDCSLVDCQDSDPNSQGDTDAWMRQGKEVSGCPWKGWMSSRQELGCWVCGGAGLGTHV